MTIGTILFTWAKGRMVGTDDQGNRYYTERSPRPGQRARRWVLYKGEAEASRVPARWHGWLHHMFEEPLEESATPAWGRAHQANPTGSDQAYLPQGHDLKGGKRAHATGDYEAWRP